MAVGAFRDHTKGFERDFVCRGDHLLHRRAVPAPRRQARQDREARRRQRQRPPRPAARSSCATTGRSGGKTYPAGALLATDFEAFLKGERRFDVLFEPTRAQVARRLQPDARTTSCSTSSTTSATASTCSTRKDGTWTREPLPGMPEFGTVERERGRRRGVGRLLPDRHRLPHADRASRSARSGKGAAREAQAAARVLRREGPRRSSQHEATSKDGTRVPYFQVAREEPRARRQEPDAALRLRRLRDLDGPRLQRRRRARRGSRRAASTSSPTSAAAASSARSGTRPRSRRTATRPTRTSSPSPRT